VAVLILGLFIFLGVHAFTTLRGPRARIIARIGEGPYKGLYSAKAILGFALIAWGFHIYRQTGWVQLWTPPAWGRHVTITLMWFAFVSFAASGKSPGRIRGWVRHPMITAVKIWALAHLLANGDLGGLILFGAVLAWAVYDRITLKARGDLGAPRVPHFTRADAIALAAGTAAWAAMIFLHPYLIGVPVIP
jgi:uncharacterized membrane protein